MKKTQKQLMTIFVSFVVMSALIVLVFETGILSSGYLAGKEPSEFILTLMMELITLGCAFLALRLFKFETIRHDLLNRKETALMKWCMKRLLLLMLPLTIDTLLYYIYIKPTFGYLAIIMVLCLPFIYPSMDRCLTETEEEPSETVIPTKTEEKE
jgi:hypothetical protein